MGAGVGLGNRRGLVVGPQISTMLHCSGLASLGSLACMDPLDSKVSLIDQKPSASPSPSSSPSGSLLRERIYAVPGKET